MLNLCDSYSRNTTDRLIYHKSSNLKTKTTDEYVFGVKLSHTVGEDIVGCPFPREILHIICDYIFYCGNTITIYHKHLISALEQLNNLAWEDGISSRMLNSGFIMIQLPGRCIRYLCVKEKISMTIEFSSGFIMLISFDKSNLLDSAHVVSIAVNNLKIYNRDPYVTHGIVSLLPYRSNVCIYKYGFETLSIDYGGGKKTLDDTVLGKIQKIPAHSQMHFCDHNCTDIFANSFVRAIKDFPRIYTNGVPGEGRRRYPFAGESSTIYDCTTTYRYGMLDTVDKCVDLSKNPAEKIILRNYNWKHAESSVSGRDTKVQPGILASNGLVHLEYEKTKTYFYQYENLCYLDSEYDNYTRPVVTLYYLQYFPLLPICRIHSIYGSILILIKEPSDFAADVEEIMDHTNKKNFDFSKWRTFIEKNIDHSLGGYNRIQYPL